MRIVRPGYLPRNAVSWCRRRSRAHRAPPGLVWHTAIVAVWLLHPLFYSAFAADQWWDPAWSARRPIDIRPTGAGVAGNETGFVEFRGLKRLAKDGQDIRIVSEGRAVPLKVLFVGADDTVSVAFRMAREQKDYAVYFGNPKAPPLTAVWEPERGLWLETRRYNGGDCGNWPQMRELLKRSGPAFGMGPVANVFCGWNPFSNEERWVSVYQGFLHCREAGEYVFCTSSDDGSFLLVDDKLIVQHPGWHGPEGQARFTEKAQLTAGGHTFAYYHVNGSGQGIMAAYWQPPSGKRIEPIPPEAFTAIAQGRAGTIELHSGKAVDIETSLAGEAYVGERPLVKFRFRARGQGGLRDVRWDFGDGQTAEGEMVEHIYLHSGLFAVKTTATRSGQDVEAETTLNAHIDFNRQTERRKDAPAAYLDRVKKYNFARLDPGSLEAAALFFFLLEDVDGQIMAARALLAREQIPPPLYFEQAMRLQVLLREKKNDPDGALTVLKAADERVKADKNLRAKILREIGDVYYYHMHDLDRALLEYDKVVGRYFGLEDNIVRITKIRIGDIMRERGDYQKAAKNYEEAERLRIDTWTPQQQPVRLGTLVHATEDFLRRGDAAEARKWIEIWDWEFPLERLRGQSSLLRARIALLERNVPEAVKQLEALVRVNPESPYVGDALWMLAEQALAQKQSDKATLLLKDLVDKHPDSEMAPKADGKLKELAGGKKIAEKPSATTAIPPPGTPSGPEFPVKK